MPNSDITPRTWEIARECAEVFGAIPQAFQGCIRTLRQNHLSNMHAGRWGLDDASQQSLFRLLQSQTLKSCFYFALVTFYEEALNGKEYLSTKDIVSPFSPGALASILALTYLNKFSKRVLSEGWESLSRRVQESSEIGGLLGQATPQLGFDSSLFVGGMRHLSFAPVLAAKPRLFIDYKRHLKKAGIPFDYQWELENIGCTLGQIGSILLQHSGFGIPYADAFFQATSTRFDFPVSPESNAFRMVAVWSEGILLACPIPSIEGEDEYAMEEYQMNNLLAKAEEIRENGSKHSFLNKTREDLSPTKTPLLYTPQERAEAQAEDAGRDEIDDLLR